MPPPEPGSNRTRPATGLAAHRLSRGLNSQPCTPPVSVAWAAGMRTEVPAKPGGGLLCWLAVVAWLKRRAELLTPGPVVVDLRRTLVESPLVELERLGKPSAEMGAVAALERQLMHSSHWYTLVWMKTTTLALQVFIWTGLCLKNDTDPVFLLCVSISLVHTLSIFQAHLPPKKYNTSVCCSRLFLV